MTDSQQRAPRDTPRTRRTVVVPPASTWSACSGRATGTALLERAFDAGCTCAATGSRSRRPGRDRARRAAARRARDAAPHRQASPSRPSSGSSMLRAETTSGRRRALPRHPQQPRPLDPAQDTEPEALRRLDRQAHDHVRHRTSRPRQDLLRHGEGRAGAAVKNVNRIILSRPAVEAGERLGFLPGTLSEKIDPYLRPLYDALHDMVDPESIPKLLAAGPSRSRRWRFLRGRRWTTRSSSSTRPRTPRPSR